MSCSPDFRQLSTPRCRETSGITALNRDDCGALPASIGAAYCAPMTISGVEQAGRILRVLHVEDSELDHQLIAAQLKRAGLQVEMERLDALAAVLAVLDRPWDAIISDYNLPGYSGLQVLEALKERRLQTPFILVSGEIGEDTACLLYTSPSPRD